MCWWNTSFLSKIKPKYFHVFLGHKTGPPMGVRSRDSVRSVKVEYFSVGVFYYEIKLLQQLCHDIVATIKAAIRNVERCVLRDKESIINERNDRDWNIEIFRHFSRI